MTRSDLVLRSIDTNQQPLQEASSTQKVTKVVDDFADVLCAPTYTSDSGSDDESTASSESSASEEEQQRMDFATVCSFRVAEDLDGDLEELGIMEWSLDDFVYERHLGSGGSAEAVVVARECQSKHAVALKIQKLAAGHHGSEDNDAVRELDIHEPLKHPCIVEMIDYFYTDRIFDQIKIDNEDEAENTDSEYVVMILELCNGGDMFDVAQNVHEENEENCFQNGVVACLGFPEQRAAKYFYDAVQALEYLHEKHEIIHCDIKSQNFLVHNDPASGESTLKLADFGMAVRYDERELVGGSPIYMAPEHLLAWRHLTSDFDYKSDIYSLGVVLYEILVGYLPYEVIENKTNNSGIEEDLELDKAFEKLTVASEEEESLGSGSGLGLPILDLRKLDDTTSDEPFYVPPPIFPDFVSADARDLISRLMEPEPTTRLSLCQVREHPWLKRHVKKTEH